VTPYLQLGDSKSSARSFETSRSLRLADQWPLPLRENSGPASVPLRSLARPRNEVWCWIYGNSLQQISVH
jgi:hypothetical protein